MNPSSKGDPHESLKMNECRVALISFESRFARPVENLGRIIQWVRTAAGKKADLVCFPEVALQGYCDDVGTIRGQAETLDGPMCAELTAVAGECGLVISLGMALRADDDLLNAQVFVGAGGVLGYAAKVHHGKDGHSCYSSGKTWPVIDLGFAKVGTLICWDAEFPEAARCLALGGADVLLMSFASGRCDSSGRRQEPEEWAEQVLAWAPSRAYDNRVFVLGVNHAGNVRDEENSCEPALGDAEGVHHWPGYSFSAGPDGRLLAESTRHHNDERMLLVDLDPKLRERWRSGSGDFLANRHPETYTRIVH